MTKFFSSWSLTNGNEYDGTYEATLFVNPSNVPSATYNIYEQLSGFEDPGGFRPMAWTILSLQVRNNNSGGGF